jgi:MscS family membrane protein
MLLFRGRTGIDWLSNFSSLLLSILLATCLTGSVGAQEEVDRQTSIVQDTDGSDATALLRPIRTDSPQQTLRSFIILREDLEDELGQYLIDKTLYGERRLVLTLLQLVELIDMSEVPSAARRDVGVDTVAHLLDIFGRGLLPNTLSVPDAEDLEENADFKSYLIPNTPFRIVRITEGERAGDFLLSAKTVRTAPNFARALDAIPLDSPLDIESWSRFLPQLTGWAIPGWLEVMVPKPLNKVIFDTPIWKVLFVAITVLAALLLFGRWYNFLGSRKGETRLRKKLVKSLWPLSVIFTALALQAFFETQVNLTGSFAVLTSSCLIAARYLAGAYLLWLLVQAFFEWIISSPRISDKGLNASLLRLFAQFTATVGSVILLAFGAQELGLPVFSILAGLGIGGLAIALAIRPTMENLIGGFILYLDKPVAIGDFCELDGKIGSVERIGIRSTQIRRLDRTLVSIPNALFADMQITNWSECNEMLIQHTIGLRYETDPDQLRHVLAAIRKMLLSHPKVTSDTVRVRFTGYGSSSLDIEVRVYTKTTDFNEFYAIREDIMLRIKDIVKDSGTGFAFPSMTMYAAQDDGLDRERAEKAKSTVEDWRRDGQLPFPEFTRPVAERFRGTLDYPPRGSSNLGREAAEDLSEEPSSKSKVSGREE